MLDAAILVVFPISMAYAALSDFLTMQISNRISLLLVAGFLIVAVAVGLPWPVIVLHIAAGVAVLGLAFSLFAFGWIGGGDAKLASATAVWLGFEHLFDYGLDASIFGFVLTLALIQARRLPMPAWLSARAFAARLLRKGNGVPYGIALALAGLLIYPETILWSTVAGS